MTQVVTVLTIDARGAEAGSATYIRAQAAAQRAVDQTLERQERLQRAMDAGASVVGRQAESITRAAQSWDRLRSSVDPAVAAQRAVEQAMLKADAAVRRGVSSQEEAARVVDLVRKRYEATLQPINDNAAALAKLSQQYDPLLVNEERRTAALKSADTLLKQKVIDEQKHATIIANVNKVHDDTKKALEGAFTATGKYASGVGLARHELINLGRQAQDVFVSLASGQSPMTVLIQQGTQIADVFAASRGSVMGFLGQIGPALLRLAGPIALVTSALTAMYAAFKVSSEQQTLSNSLLGAGRASGLTGGQMEGLARESAQAADITVSNARLIGAEYVKLGRIANDNLPKLTQITKDYAAATGQDLKNSAQEIAQALADPTRGAQGLSDKIGGLDSTTLRMIRTATDFNDKLRAQKLLMEELGRATDNAADQSLSKWDRLTKEMGLVFGRLKEGAAGLVMGPDRSEEIIAARERIAGLERRLANTRPDSRYSDLAAKRELEDERGKLAVLEEAERKTRDLAAARARASEANKRVTDGEAVALATNNQGLAQRLRLYNETIGQVSTLEKSTDALRARRDAIGVPDATNRGEFATLTQQIKEQTEALEAQKRRVADLQSVQSGLTMEQERARRGTEIDLKASRDKTLADAQETAAMRARNEAFGTARTQAEEDLRVKQAQREAAVRGTVAVNEQSKALQDGIAVSNAQTEAFRRGGVAAAEVARIRKEAEQQARSAGGDVEVIFRERLNKEIAETRRGLAEKLALQKQEVSAASAANSAAAAGNLSAKQRADLEERLRVEREAHNKLIATGLVSDREAARLAREQANSVSRAQSARTDSEALDYLYQQRQTLEAQRKQIELVGLTRSARYEELEVLRAQQYLVERGISQESERGKEILRNARLIGEQNKQLEQQERIQHQIRQAQEFAADSLKSFLDELLTGTEGLNGALKSLGKGYLSASIDALISGKGPLAGLTGLASTSRDGQGGVLGLLTNGIAGLGKQVEKGAEKGAEKGVVGGVVAANDNWNLFGGLGINGKDLAGGLSAIAGLAGAYGSGMQAGSYAQAGFGGAISGGMAGLSLAGTSIGASLGGASVLGPIGAAIGVGLALYGQQQARKAAKEERQRQAQETYREAQPQIATMRSQLRGEPQDTLQKRIAETETSTRKLTDVMFFAGKIDEAHATYVDFIGYKTRSIADFHRAFDGLVSSLMDGLGPNSAFSSAREAVKQTGDTLKGFISDAEYAFGAGSAQVGQARQAAVAHALSIMDGSKTLSTVATRMEEIRGAGAALQQVLVDLGWAASDAARAVAEGTTAALARLKASFETDLGRKTNDALDRGYVNEVSDLVKELATLRADAAALGSDQGLVTDYFRAQAQSIVDGAQLTGSAFQNLLWQFPALIGKVSEFTGALKGAAREADIAARRLSYQDRLFAALNDSETLAGQLAAFDRAAQREREAEIKAGGEALLDLERALNAERFNIVKDFAERQKKALDEAQNFLSGFTRTIREYLDRLRAGPDTALSPGARLAAAQSQFTTQLAAAQGGDRDALNSITRYSDGLLEAAKAMHTSSPAYQAILAQVEAALGALPNQLSAEQFIVDAIEDSRDAMVEATAAMQLDLRTSLTSAIGANNASAFAAALNSHFAMLDSSVNGLLDYGELLAGLGPLATSSEQAWARAYLAQIDADGDGQISKMEAVRASTDNAANAGWHTTSAVGTSNATLAQLQHVLFNQITHNTAATADQVYGVIQQAVGINQRLDNVAEYERLIRLNVQSANQRWSAQGNSQPVPHFAAGGWVSGPGTGTSDSISARLSNGEFVMREAAASRFGGVLDYMNDNLRLPAMPMPVGVMPIQGGSGNAEMVAELRALRAEVAELRGEARRNGDIAAAGHKRTAEAVDEQTVAVKRDTKLSKRAQAPFGRVSAA